MMALNTETKKCDNGGSDRQTENVTLNVNLGSDDGSENWNQETR